MNTIGVIAPYRHEGMWAFDDPRVRLNREPFVGEEDHEDSLCNFLRHCSVPE